MEMKRTRWADRAVSAAVLAAALAVGGCAAPAVLAPRAGYVRLEQLVKLHPDYKAADVAIKLGIL